MTNAKDAKAKKTEKDVDREVEIDRATGMPLRTGNPLTDDHQPYGVPKDPKSGVALAPEPATEGEEDEPHPMEPDTATLTAAEQNKWEVLTGERLQKDVDETAPPPPVTRRFTKPDPGLPSAGPRPDQGLPPGPPPLGRPAEPKPAPR